MPKKLIKLLRRFLLPLPLLPFLVMALSSGVHAMDDNQNRNATYHIYLDADQTNSISSGRSIELGIRAALHEAGEKLGTFPVELIVKDHHGSTPRSQYHLKQFIQDERGLAVFGGLHSPPLISSRDYINEHGILTLVPWAAATPITRSKAEENWIFRLSLDDSKAGQVIIKEAIERSGLKQVALLLEDTGWGKANKKTMTQALKGYGLEALETHFFKWGLGEHEARSVLEGAINRGADGFILVANAPEGITFAKAMLALPKDKQRPVRSHWGITGGNFVDSLGTDALALLDLKFIQTSFSFLNAPLSPIAQQALSSAATVLNKAKLEPSDIVAPAGFIHAYDLTRLLIAAANQAPLTGEAKADRQLIKQHLEALKGSTEGLIKTYVQPFHRYNVQDKDAHEALSTEDFTMARYNASGHIVLSR